MAYLNGKRISDYLFSFAVDDKIDEQSKNPVQNRVIAEKLNDIYKNLLTVKGTESGGNPIVLPDVSPAAHEIKTRIETENLIKYPYVETTKTENGITFTDYGDGRIRLEGKATADTTFVLCNENPIINEIPGGNYFIYPLPSGVNMEIKGANIATGAEFIATVTDGKFTMHQKVKSIYLKVNAGTTLSTTAYPRIAHGSQRVELGGATVTKYEGINFLPKTKQPSQTIKGIKFVVNEDGTIRAYGTTTESGVNFKFTDSWEDLILPPGIYMFSGCPGGGTTKTYSVKAAAKDQNGEVIVDAYETGKGLVVNAPNGISSVYYSLRVNGTGTQVDCLFRPMLYIGSNIPDYEPPAERESHTADDDGNVDSYIGNGKILTLVANTGVAITAEYNRDANKVIENIIQAIIALGGNL